MVEGGTSGCALWDSSTSSHSSSSSSSSKGRYPRLLIRVSPSVRSERIHSFFDKSLAQTKQPIGPGFVKKVSRKSEDTVLVSIEDALIANRLVSSFADSRSKIDGHEFSIELYSSADQPKSLSSPSHNGDKRREKESARIPSCSSHPSPSSKRPSHFSPSTSQPSTSNEESRRNDSAVSPSEDPYKDVVGETMIGLPDLCHSLLKEILIAGVQEYGGYLNHFEEESGRTKVLYKKHHLADNIPAEGKIIVQSTEATYTTLSPEETRRLYDRHLASAKSRSCLPSTSTSSSSLPSPSSNTRDALSYSSSRTVFFPCLPKGITREELKKRFSRLGTVIEIELKNESTRAPYAIIQFAHTQAAVAAMEDYEREQREEGKEDPSRNKKSPHFRPSPPSNRVWIANLPTQDEDYVKKKLMELLKGAVSPTIVVDLRRREGIIDFHSHDKAKHFLEILKSSPIIQQGGAVHTWLVADYCSKELYEQFIERRGLAPTQQENEYVSALARMTPTETQRSQANERMKSMKGGEEKTGEKKRSMNGENGNHSHSPSSTRRLNGEDRRSGDSGFSEDRDKTHALDSDSDEMLEKRWKEGCAPVNDRSEENGMMKKRIIQHMSNLKLFANGLPREERPKKVKEEEGEKKENEKTSKEIVNGFSHLVLGVTTPLKAKRFDEEKYRRKEQLRSPPTAASPFNGDKERRRSSPPSGSRPSQLHITIPPSSSTTHHNHSPYPRVPSTSSSRHPSISTPSSLTPRSHTLPSSRPPFPSEHNGDHHWNREGHSTVGTPTSSRLPLSRRESVCSNSSQSHTPLPPSGTLYTPTSLKSPPVNSWSSSANAWKGGPSLASPLPHSINRSRPSMDSHHKSSTSSLSRPQGLPKTGMDKAGYCPSSSLPKTPSLPRSSSMNEKKPNIARESSKDIVNNIIQNKSGHLKNMQRIPKKENRERDEKEERKEKKREEKDRERREDREERKEKKEDRKKSRENETKEEKARRKELKRKEREREERKKSSTNEKEKKRKSIDVEKKKKKKRMSESADSDLDSDESVNFKSKQIDADEAYARQLQYGGSMYDRVKVRRSGGGKEEKKKSDALEAIRKKNVKKTSKKRVHLSSSDESDEELKESGKKKREKEEESSDEEGEERVKKAKKTERKRERRESSEESDSEEEKERKRKKEKKVLKKASTLDLFSDADSVTSEKKEKLVKKRSHEKEEKLGSPSSSIHPPPEKKVKKEETPSSQSDSDEEGERSSKKSEVSASSYRGRKEDKNRRLSESSIATHSEKDEAWKSPASGSGEKEIKEEPKESAPPPRLMTKAAMKEFNLTASSSPVASNWNTNRDDKGINLSSDSSQSSSDSEEEKEEGEERKEEEERREEEETREEPPVERMEEEQIEEEPVEIKEEEPIEEKKEELSSFISKEEEKEEEVEVKMEVEEAIENDEEAESAVRGLESPSEDVIEETEKAVESIFDEEEEPEARYPSNDFLNSHDINLSSSSSQCSSPKVLPSSALPHRPTPLHPSSISSPSILSPSPFHPHLLHSHSIPPPVSSPLISPHLITSPSTSRHFNIRPISQESSSQHVIDDNGVLIHQEKSWTPQGSSSDGPSPSPNHQMMNKEEIMRKFPTKWQGKIGVKKNEINTSWCRVHGNDELMNAIFPESLSISRVTQKFRLDNENITDLVQTITDSNDTACLVVTPAGMTQDEVIQNRDLFTEHLVNFFNKKAIAGISEFVHENGDTYVCHYFAPGQFVTDYLSPRYPDFLELLNRRYPNTFLLALFKRKN